VLNASTLEDFLPSDAPFDPTSRLLLQQALQEGKSFTKIPSATGPLHCYLGSVPGRDWLIAVAVPEHAMRQPVLRMLARQAALLLAIMALAGLAALRLGIVQFRPLGEIIAVVRDFPRQDFTRPLDFNSRLPLGRRDELGDLARALVEMGEMLRKTLDGMLKATAAKERLEGELTAARRIQEGLLPTLTPEFGPHATLELFASMKPARHVGGDLYDFFFVSETKLCVAVGDVAGKGVPAALFMSSAVTLLRGLSHGMASPAAIVSAINRDLSARNPENMFVTMAVGIYDTRTCVFTFTLAGHPAPALVPGAGGDCRLLDDFTPDIVAGVLANACYHDHKIALEPGDTLFFYTDGISEAPGAQGEFFGQKGILHGLEKLRDKALPEVCNGMLRLAENFSQALPQADDATVLALRRKGNPHG
ncbi:MAG: SpoIIE family protein phosphatase, partial [Desulfovibrio sp.]|nr:SpoIIE family protein phosphatase [Desulfovibrio sp.]